MPEEQSSLTTATTTTPPAPASPGAAAAAAVPKGKKMTEYVVLKGDSPTGPFSVVGNHTTQGQSAAKKSAAADEVSSGGDPEKSFFVAVPASSFAPQKPVVQMLITFVADDGSIEEDDADLVDEEA